MAKKIKGTPIKESKKASTKSTEKAATKKTTTKKATTKNATATTKAKAKVTNIAKAQTGKKTQAVPDEKLDSEKNLAASCQEMMSSIIQWTMDSLMYSNIMLISKKLNISIENAAEILDVNKTDLAGLALVYAAYSRTPEAEKAAVLGKYSDRIKPFEPDITSDKGKKK